MRTLASKMSADGSGTPGIGAPGGSIKTLSLEVSKHAAVLPAKHCMLTPTARSWFSSLSVSRGLGKGLKGRQGRSGPEPKSGAKNRKQSPDPAIVPWSLMYATG
jgi:hypothetical protein